MFPKRQVARAATRPATHTLRPRQQHIRFQSSSTTSSSSSSSNSTHLATSFAGGLVGSALFYAAYTYTPAGRASSTINKTVAEAAQKYDEAARKLQQNTPSADQAVDSIKQFAYSYVAFIPGGREYVDLAFKDWEAVRKNHKDDADKIVNDAYKQLQAISKGGLSMETATKALDVLADFSRKMAAVSADAFSDVVDNHPQLKDKFGGSVEQLKSMGEKYGPEAKKKVEETWEEVKGILKEGFSVANVDKVKKLLEEKQEEVKKLGDKAWEKALKEANPVLDKIPEVKKLIEENADKLKNGNYQEIFEEAKSAAESGDAENVKKHIKSMLFDSGSK